jgi:hypothetical protein
LNKEEYKKNAACGISASILFAAVIFWMGCRGTPVENAAADSATVDDTTVKYAEEKNEIMASSDTLALKRIMVKGDLSMMVSSNRVILTKRYCLETREVIQKQWMFALENDQ